MIMTLEDVIGRDIQDHVRISCPFPGHDDRNPSAVYYPDGHVHCFSCGGHASSLADLIRQREFPNLPEGEGIRYAHLYISRYLRDVAETVTVAKPTPRPADDPGPDSLTLTAMTLFCDAARANLEHNEAELERISRKRGLADPVRMGIGIADSALVRVVKGTLRGLGYGDEAIDAAMHHAGVLGKDKDGSTIYRLSNRVIIAEYRDDPRHAVYYQARANNPQALQKYLNPPIRNKPLFGWESLKRDTERVWIGEGPFDILPFIEAGESAVSSMGANMTNRQVARLARSIEGREALVAYDNDDPGRAAAANVVENLRLLGIEAHAVFPRQGFHDFGEWAAAEPVASIIPETLFTLYEQEQE